MQTHVFRLPDHPRQKRRIGVQAACTACRLRKLACDGKRPRCSRCRKRGDGDCNYDTQRAEETRVQAMRREMDHMKGRLDDLAQTLAALKDLPSDGAARLVVDVLKEPDPMSSLIDLGMKIQMQSAHLNRQISMLESMRAIFPSTDSSVQFELYLSFPKWYPPLVADYVQPAVSEACYIDFVYWQKARSQFLSSASHLASGGPMDTQYSKRGEGFLIGTWNVWVTSDCLRYWTNVSISMDLAQAAISAYLRTDHVLLGFMDTELFLYDLIHRKTRHCSESLVNAMLHYACVKIARCNDEAAALVEVLQDETENALDNDHTVSPAKIAALNIHYTAILFTGPFERASPFLDKAVSSCDVLYGWEVPPPKDGARTPFSDDDEKALSHVVWSVFSSVIYRSHRWSYGVPPRTPRLPVPYLSLSARATVALEGSLGADIDKIACERYLYAAICSNLPFARESVMLKYSKELSDEVRAVSTASIYRRALDRATSIERPRALHVELTDIAAIAQMWSHLWILSLFQPLINYRGVIPGFQATNGTAAAVFVASAKQLQHLVFIYQRFHWQAPPTTTWHGPIFVAAVALTQMRRLPHAAPKFEALLWLFADLAISFPSLRDLMQSLARTGYAADLVNLPQIRSLFKQYSEMCTRQRKRSLCTQFISPESHRENLEVAAALREKNYDVHFATTYVIEELS